MESQIKKQVYYIEICTASDDDYSIQTTIFDSIEKAEKWFNSNIDYISENTTARMMRMDIYAEGGYDIEDIGYLDENNNWIITKNKNN